MKKKSIFILLLTILSFSSSSQIHKGKEYTYAHTLLCHDSFIFYDSVGFFMSGCEAHPKIITAFKYKTDSANIECDLVPYTIFDPCSAIIKKKIPGQDGIKIVVEEFSGEKVFPEVAVIKLERKSYKIIKSYTSLTDTLVFEKYTGRKILWTLEGLFPIFIAELHFKFDSPFNYYEIHLNLPYMCFQVTEAKMWRSGKIFAKILDDRHIESEGFTHEYCGN